MTDTGHSNRHSLIRCVVENRDGVSSIRFVEQTHYRLWQYMMANKHELMVRDAALCLWLSAREFTAHENLFSQAGEPEAVDCLSFAIYDEETGFCSTLQRFVPAAESVRVGELLFNRVPPPLRDSDDFAMETARGYAIIRAKGLDLSRLGLHFDA